MDPFTSNPGFPVFALSVLVLLLKIFALTLSTPVVRARSKVKVNPEDSGGELAVVQPDAVARMHRVVHNDLENIPMFILIGVVAIMAGVGPKLLMVCSVGFVLTRLAHTLFYVGKKSAPRTASYALGVLFTLTLAFGSIVPLLWK